MHMESDRMIDSAPNRTVQVYGWKPSSGINFGDEIGVDIVRGMAKLNGTEVSVMATSTAGNNKLLAVGSIIQMAGRGDVIWGSGVNGKVWLPKNITKLGLKATAVRGPISRHALINAGIFCPEVYGDPGLLFPIIFHEEIARERQFLKDHFRKFGLQIPKRIFIPNLNDLKFYLPELSSLKEASLVRPSNSAARVAAYISLADEVVSSSLHGVVFADVLGKKVQLVASRFEALLKYDDYFLGTSREPVTPNRWTGEFIPNVAPLKYDYRDLIAAFPLSSDSSLIASLALERINSLALEPEAIAEKDKSVHALKISDRTVYAAGQIFTLVIPNNPLTRGQKLSFSILGMKTGMGTRGYACSVNGSRGDVEASINGASVTVSVRMPENLSGPEISVKFNLSKVEKVDRHSANVPDGHFVVFDKVSVGGIS